MLRDVGVVAGHRLVGAALGHHDVDHVRAVVGAALQDLPGGDRAADVQVGEVGPVGSRCLRLSASSASLAERGVPVGEQVVDGAEGGDVAHPVAADEAGERGPTSAAVPAARRRKTPSAKPAARPGSTPVGANVMKWTLGACVRRRKYLFSMPGIAWLIPRLPAQTGHSRGRLPSGRPGASAPPGRRSCSAASRRPPPARPGRTAARGWRAGRCGPPAAPSAPA